MKEKRLRVICKKCGWEREIETDILEKKDLSCMICSSLCDVEDTYTNTEILNELFEEMGVEGTLEFLTRKGVLGEYRWELKQRGIKT